MARTVLTGFRGTGKTRVGELLAHMLGIPFFDTDTMVENKAGMTIFEIFQKYGEEHFRRLECEVIRSLQYTDSVVSTGGGAVMNPENVASLRKESTVFLLTADDRTIEDRIARTKRPALTRLPLREEIHELQRLRRPHYLSSADFCIDTSGRDTNETAMTIRRVLSDGITTEKDRQDFMTFARSTRINREDANALERGFASEDSDPLTRLYAIAGNPCSHSLSPPLFNHLFSTYRINALYTRLCWPDFPELAREAKKAGIRGLSVTHPFKQDALAASDEADEHATAIGAANTLLFCEGITYGFNTDWIGIKTPLSHLRESRAVVLGAGGAAAAAVYALQSLGIEVTIVNRTPAKAKDLAERFSCRTATPAQFAETEPDVVVNATPVGMEPDGGIPLNPALLKKSMTVFDFVYTPAETPLIRAARNAGCAVIPGTEMFVGQACAQFRQFTGIEVPVAEVRGFLL